MPTNNFNPKVDAYINKAKPLAQPILEHLRELVHKGCPKVEETIKWSRPFFEYKGAILGNMSAFKEHCSFGFWGEEIGAVLREAESLAPRRHGLTRPHHQRQRPAARQANAQLDPPGRHLHRQRPTTPAPSRRETRWSKRQNPHPKLLTNSQPP